MKRSIFMLIIWLVCILSPISKANAQENTPRFEHARCPIEVPSEPMIECGFLITLEDYDNPNSRTIRTAVIIIHSKNPNPTKEALLFTEGGPGYSSLRFVWWLVDTQFLKNRDIIILEQRGNIYADPSLTCDFSIWWEEEHGHTPCLDSLQQRGIPLEHYNTTAIAADINALKHALDYQVWHLFGSSYSTRVMQLVMSRYPQNIRSVVLHSISPVSDSRYRHDPEHAGRALKIMFTDCAADPDCAKAYPDLESRVYALVRQLNAQPLEFEITYPNSAERFTLEVNGDTLIGWMVGSAFYGPAYPPYATAYLPLLIDKVSRGNTDLLYPWAKSHISRWADDGYAWGLFFSINCQEEAPMINSRVIDAQIDAYPEMDGYYRHADELAICASWGLQAAPSLPSEPIVSDIPTLVLAGTYDPITPPEWGKTTVATLGKSTYVEFPSLGHSVLSNSLCAEQSVSEFLDNPTLPPDSSCVQDEPETQFVLPGEIIIAPAMYEIHYDELGYSQLEENIFLSSWVTLVATGLIALIAGLVKMARRKQTTLNTITSIAYPLLIVLAATALGWGYALRFSLQHIAASTSNILRFGLPSAYWWLFVVVILIGLMTIALIGITALSWKRKVGSLIEKLFFTLAILAAITFTGVLTNWGLFTALFR